MMPYCCFVDSFSSILVYIIVYELSFDYFYPNECLWIKVYKVYTSKYFSIVFFLLLLEFKFYPLSVFQSE